MNAPPSSQREHISAVRILAILTAAAGLFGCLATLLCYRYLARFQRQPLARAVAIHAALLIPATATKLVPGSMVSPAVCTAAGAIMQVGEMAALGWLTTMACLAAAVSFRSSFGRRRDVKSTETRVLIVVVSLSLLTILPALLAQANDKAPALFRNNLAWCWISTAHPQYRLLASLVPQLMLSVVLLAAIVPTALYVWSARAQADAEEASHLAALGQSAERKLSLFRRSSTFGLAQPPMPAYKPGPVERFMRPYARSAVIYCTFLFIMVQVPAYLARLFFTFAAVNAPRSIDSPAGEEVAVGWSLVQVLFAPLAGFASFVVLFFLSFLSPPSTSTRITPVDSRRGSTTPISPYVYGGGMVVPMPRRSITSDMVAAAQQKQRRMSRKRSRMLSSTGLEEVWHGEHLNAALSDSEDTMTSEESEVDVPITPRKGSQAAAGGRTVVADLANMIRRPSRPTTSTGRLMTWAERRRLLLEQQNAPMPALRNGTDADRPGSPRHLNAFRPTMELDQVSVLSSVQSELEDDPLSMPTTEAKRVNWRDSDVFRP